LNVRFVTRHPVFVLFFASRSARSPFFFSRLDCFGSFFRIRRCFLSSRLSNRFTALIVFFAVRFAVLFARFAIRRPVLASEFDAMYFLTRFATVNFLRAISGPCFPSRPVQPHLE
jgi:hypothetical protein